MTEAEIYAQLTDTAREVFNDDDVTMTPDTTADDVPQWDSMTHIFLVVEIERRFGIKFQTAEMEELKNVGELVHVIEGKLAAKAA
ncbi:MAG: acyl carrier protein [Acetobacteraceae bacterium]|nr:acyl carrier protein [Acetobacteraceae bacterium]